VRVAGGWPTSFWDMWCQFVAGVVAAVGRSGYAVEVVVAGGGELGCAAEVVEDGWRWAGAACGRAKLLASALAGEGC
jgi:hypothetical protein